MRALKLCVLFFFLEVLIMALTFILVLNIWIMYLEIFYGCEETLIHKMF